ncbi:MAG: phosphate regulon sensor histidine kinase PhoR [Marinicellaceae bacterium]
MRNKSFKTEQLFALIFIVLSIITGAIFNHWALGFVFWAMVYIIWKWAEFYSFYKWYKKGANVNDVPLISGIWEDLCALVIHNKKRNLKIKKKNTFLLNQFNATAQALPYATILLNKRFEITWANPASNGILGVIQGKDEGSKIDNIIRDPIFNTMLLELDDSHEIKITHPNDKDRKVQVRMVKLSNKRYLLVARDISEQEQLRKSRKAFVDNASHELRTPLTVIAGYLEMFHESNDFSETWKSAIDQAILQSNRMEKIINDMLKLSSMEHEQYLEGTSTVIDMPNLLNRIFNDVKNSTQSKQHVFFANIDSELKIIGNEEEIVSIGLNLLNNAIIHTKNDTEVTLKWYRRDNKAFLEVCDNGEGIEAKHLNHLTERFYRVDNSRHKNTTSTGLGLAIVKQICDNHGAKLTINSQPETGTCFHIVFPADRIVN